MAFIAEQNQTSNILQFSRVTHCTLGLYNTARFNNHSVPKQNFTMKNYTTQWNVTPGLPN